jgi:hypothetical protein
MGYIQAGSRLAVSVGLAPAAGMAQALARFLEGPPEEVRAASGRGGGRRRPLQQASRRNAHPNPRP